jgi:excisionase family DNA binding protein
MSNTSTPLYVRLSADPHTRLERAVSVSGKSKRQLVEDAVRDHFDGEGLVVGHVALREPTPEVLTPGEAAALLRIEESQVREAAERGEVPGRQIAGEWRFSRDALLDWLGVDA